MSESLSSRVVRAGDEPGVEWTPGVTDSDPHTQGCFFWADPPFSFVPKHGKDGDHAISNLSQKPLRLRLEGRYGSRRKTSQAEQGCGARLVIAPMDEAHCDPPTSNFERDATQWRRRQAVYNPDVDVSASTRVNGFAYDALRLAFLYLSAFLDRTSTRRVPLPFKWRARPLTSWFHPLPR